MFWLKIWFWINVWMMKMAEDQHTRALLLKEKTLSNITEICLIKERRAQRGSSHEETRRRVQS